MRLPLLLAAFLWAGSISAQTRLDPRLVGYWGAVSAAVNTQTGERAKLLAVIHFDSAGQFTSVLKRVVNEHGAADDPDTYQAVLRTQGEWTLAEGGFGSKMLCVKAHSEEHCQTYTFDDAAQQFEWNGVAFGKLSPEFIAHVAPEILRTSDDRTLRRS